MTLRSRLLFAVLAAAVTTAAGATTAAAQRRGVTSRDSRGPYRSRVDTTVAFDRNGTITVNAGSGDVIVTGVSTNQLHVRAISDDEDIRFDYSPGRVELSTARRGSDTRFELTVPIGARVIARSQSGDVSIKGTRGEVEVSGASGDIQVDDVVGRLTVNSFSGEVTASSVNGDVEVNTQSGDLKLTDVRGDVQVGNTSGDITMRGMTSKLVRAKTTSGDVTYDGTIDPAGRYDLISNSGDVHLRIPREANAQLNVSTWNGEINSDFPITLKPGMHDIGASTSKHFTFEIGGGAARITAETFSGDVTVSSNGRGATPRP